MRRLGAGGAGALAAPLLPAWVVGRGHEAALLAAAATAAPPPQPGLVRLDSNENPRGPAPEALDALRAALGEAGRYPDAPIDELHAALAALHRVSPESVLLGCGSSDVIRMAVSELTAPGRALVTAAPSFEYAVHYAQALGAPVRAVPVTADLRLDLARMAASCRESATGLVYLCNPNNPTGTVHSARAVSDFIDAVRTPIPGAAQALPTVLVDEAYHEYVQDPSYASAIRLTASNPGVLVSRTFSKAYGMAGLRVGYAVAHPTTIARLRGRQLFDGVNVLGAAAALRSLRVTGHVERQRALNREARDFTRRYFESAGYAVAPSEANFLMADIRRDSKAFQTACRERGVSVGRPFPPLTTRARITIGTLEEMQRAVGVFKEVLG